MSKCEPAGGVAEVWAELSMWGDSIAARLAWNAHLSHPTRIPDGCTAEVKISMVNGGGTVVDKKTVLDPNVAGEMNVLLVVDETSGMLTPVADLTSSSDTTWKPAVVTLRGSASGNAKATVLARPKTRDVFVEVPKNFPKCKFVLTCSCTLERRPHPLSLPNLSDCTCKFDLHLT